MYKPIHILTLLLKASAYNSFTQLVTNVINTGIDEGLGEIFADFTKLTVNLNVLVFLLNTGFDGFDA